MLIVNISELAKRNNRFAALLLTTLLAFIWMHLADAAPLHMADLSHRFFCLVAVTAVIFGVTCDAKTKFRILSQPCAGKYRDQHALFNPAADAQKI